MAASMIVRLLVAAALVLVALDDGASSLESRSSLSLLVWWAIAVGFAVGVLPGRRPGRGALVAIGLLAGFTIVTYASLAWAASDERAFLEADRTALYLGCFVLAACAPGRSAPALVDGLAAGCAGVAFIALGSRLFPDLLGGRELAEFLPSAAARLSYPVGYWNGLAILAALGLPLLLRSAVDSASPIARGLAVAPVPVLASVVYLASSRGAAATGAAAVVAFCALERRRWAALGAVATAAAGSAAALAVLLDRTALVEGPIGSDVAAAEGRSAALLLALVVLATGAAHALGARLVRMPRVPRTAAWAAAALVVVLGVAGVAAAQPLDAFRTFKEPPAEFSRPRSDFVRAHFLSGGGSGRWQIWEAAVAEFRTRPLVGRGAGSFEAWWAEHGSLAYFVRDAHSLYLEVLGELGLLGFALLVSGLGVALATGLGRLRGADPRSRTTLAALAAAFVAYALAAGIDWMWETTVVSLVGLACLGLLVAAPGPPRRLPRTARAAAALAAVAVLVATAVPLLASLELERSRDAVRTGELAGARAHALAARDVEPWAASTYLQLALVAEERGDLPSARAHVRDALRRDGSDWRLWLVAARLDTKAGAIAAARRDLARAVELNPRSPLFANPR